MVLPFPTQPRGVLLALARSGLEVWGDEKHGYLRFSVARERQVSQPLGGRRSRGAAKRFPRIRLGGSLALP